MNHSLTFILIDMKWKGHLRDSNEHLGKDDEEQVIVAGTD